MYGLRKALELEICTALGILGWGKAGSGKIRPGFGHA